MKVVSNTIRIRWDTRMLALPLMGKAGITHYNIECPASGTIGTGQTIGANFSAFCAIYYQMPTGSSQFTTLVGNFRIVPFGNPRREFPHRAIRQHDRKHRAELGAAGRAEH